MNKVHSHPDQPQLQAEVILASKGPNQKPIFTVRGRLPRNIWPEVLTHRVFSRNGRSSRAVPVKKMIKEIKTAPFVPWHWGKDQKGMQAKEDCNAPINLGLRGGMPIVLSNEQAWRASASAVAELADAFREAGYHKQVVNRLLEPYMWIDVLITSTNWENFFWLREHEDAEPHLQDWALLVDNALHDCEIVPLISHKHWHLPYITDDDRGWAFNQGVTEEKAWDALRRISAARCARISYTPFDADKPDISKDFAVFDKLMANARIHASPMEHQARPDYFTGGSWLNPEMHGNLSGYIQFRKMIPNENCTGPLPDIEL